MRDLPRRLLLLFACSGSIGVGAAAEPPDAASTHGRASRPAQSTQPEQAGAGHQGHPAAPLDLKLGDASRYFPPGELEKPLDERLEEIFVNGRRAEPIRDGRDVPPGLFPSLRHAATHPLDAWRILAPMPNVRIPDRNADDPKDPPGSFRGRILEPGAIYD